MKKKLPIITALTALIFLAGCNVMPSYVGFEDFEENLMSSYRMIGYSDYTVEQSRAIAPIWPIANGGVGEKALSNGVTYTLADYPEYGQNTSWTYNDASGTYGTNVWKVSVLTEFPNDIMILKTEEVYYILNSAPLESHGNEDIIIDPSNTSTENNLFREKFETTMADGSIRYDVIVNDASTSGGEVKYAFIDLNGTLSYSSASPVADSFDPAESTAQRWSSTVEFAHRTSSSINWGFWGKLNNIAVTGTRYYSSGYVDGVLHQTYLIKEEGTVNNPDWSAEFTGLESLSKGKTAFTGVLRVEIVGSTKRLVGQYVIEDKKGRIYVLNIENSTITLQR